MSDVVVKIEDLSKQYRLGLVGTNTLKGDIQRWWYNIIGKEDPFMKIGQENKLDNVDGEYVWALKDNNLEVNQGEVLGIIRKNGAGKSTLLKIISRITTPSSGNIKIKGRVASLLEVGTGFHGELTGRENIFLNGAILGMTKTEIKSRFDEIVDFAGIAKYIDTPVKRYSSGMYVRLGFAVAAHLDPEILIVDEVLAVGDAEFQKKAIGKMKDLSKGQGRTVLFVSHNMASVRNLCTRGILLGNGIIANNGDVEKIVEKYLRRIDSSYKLENDVLKEQENVVFYYAKVFFSGQERSNGSEIIIHIEYELKIDKEFAVILNVNRNEELAFASTSFFKTKPYKGKGKYSVKFVIPKYLLNPGFHSFDFSVVDGTGNMFQYAYFKDILYFEVSDDNYRRGYRYNKGWSGAVSPILKIENYDE